MASPSPYPTGSVPPLSPGNKLKRNSPAPYPVEPAPPLSGGDMLKRDSPPPPPPYTSGSVPPLSDDNMLKRGTPSPYPTGSPPPLGGGNKKRQGSPSPYPTGSVPPLGGGDKIKRDSPTAPLSSERTVKRDVPPPSTYSAAPVPTLSGNKVKRGLPTAPPSSVRTAKRDVPPPSTYSAAPVPTLSGNKVKRASDTVQASTSQPSATQTASSTSDTTASSTSTFPYLQLAGATGTPHGASFSQASLAAGDYNVLCPHGNCLTDCQNMTRVFQALPDGIHIDESTYGKWHANHSLPDLTLFGVCSNLEIVSDLAQSSYPNSSFASYFPTVNTQSALHNVSTDLSVCLFDTCQRTRDPSQCLTDCSLNALQSSNTSLSIRTGVYPCLYRLCENTCGLPYANQDVYGVGVLASYITQAILVLILAVCVIFFASLRYFKKSNDHRFLIPKRMRKSLELFLATQCYFGISAAIASYLMQPSTVDALNGYALLSVAVTGFIPTTFTLLLLHSHGVRSWYISLLTFTSWLFSSVLFFMLVRNLSNTVDNQQAIDRGLDSLFVVDSCGQSSAMNLCKQAFDTDPLAYLSWFYNYWNIPSIKTIPILWVLSTVVLICLLGVQIFNHIRQHTRGAPITMEESQSGRRRNINTTINLASLYLGSILFGLALGYQACMVISYTRMDVIDWHNWSFGQVVALLFWVPPLVNCIWSYMVDPEKGKSATRKHQPDYPYPIDKKGNYDDKVSTDQLTFRSVTDQTLFSPSDVSIYRQGSDLSDQIVQTPTDTIFGHFGRGNRNRREERQPKKVTTSVQDVIIG